MVVAATIREPLLRIIGSTTNGCWLTVMNCEFPYAHNKHQPTNNEQLYNTRKSSNRSNNDKANKPLVMALDGDDDPGEVGGVGEVNQALTALAVGGVEVNLVLFSKTVLGQTNAEAANTFSRWMGTSYLFALMGAFLSDSYFGRYLTCIIFHAVLTLGLIAVALTTQFYLLKPEGCGKLGELCEPHSQGVMAMFYLSLYLIALGSGAEPALAQLGADQFDEEDPKEKRSKSSFFGYFYVALNLGSLVSETVVVYIENMGNYMLGLWLANSAGFVAWLLLLFGTLRFRHLKPNGNPITRFSQVVVAAFKKMKFEMPRDGEGLYEVHASEANVNGMRRIHHTDGFKFLDRAAIITSSDSTFLSPNKEDNHPKAQPPNPWRLCSVTQVEEVKCVLRLLRVWLCTILPSVVFIQMLSLFIEQGAAMNTKVKNNFHIPPASMTAFDIISTSIFILFYDKLIVPIYVKIAKKKPNPPSELKRIGIGLGIVIEAMLFAGFVEQQRHKNAISVDVEASTLSIFWQTPQYVLVGVSEAFVYVAQMEFFASQTLDGLKSLGIGLSMSTTAMGSYLCTVILSVVMKIMTTNGRPGWVLGNLNRGHLDRFFFLTAALTAANLCVFVVIAKRFKCVSFEKRSGGGDGDVEKEMEDVA